MRWKAVLGSVFLLFVVVLLVFYWFIPLDTTEFFVRSRNTNFSLGNDSTSMQFYENMRFPTSEIFYRIYDCPLQKKDDMLRAFEILENQTVLNFYSINSNEEIFVTCDSKNRIEEGLFIAGEGGPTNITKTNNFNVIFRGQILLIKESKCSKPNIAIHELLHVLGFNHSDNPNNIMYSISKCRQTIGEDTIDLINELYSVPTYADLSFENVSAVMHGRYLNTNMSIWNNGLKDSEKTEIKIYADDKLIKKINLDIIKIGHGRTISLSNLLINQLNVEKLEFVIDSEFNELDKENNKIILEIKNN